MVVPAPALPKGRLVVQVLVLLRRVAGRRPQLVEPSRCPQVTQPGPALKIPQMHVLLKVALELSLPLLMLRTTLVRIIHFPFEAFLLTIHS